MNSFHYNRAGFPAHHALAGARIPKIIKRKDNHGQGMCQPMDPPRFDSGAGHKLKIGGKNMKYRKKHVVVDAFRLWFHPYPEWFFDELLDQKVFLILNSTRNKCAVIRTPEGEMRAYKGITSSVVCKAKVVLSKMENTTIEAEPVRHGKWVMCEGDWICNKCGATPADWESKPNNPWGLPPYCHSCGCKMDLGW